MPSPPNFTEMLRLVTLGTARRTPPPELLEWLDGIGAVDPTADHAEQCLMALGITERMQRLVPTLLDAETLPPTAQAPPEQRQAPSPRLARGLELVLDGTYPELLDEAMEVVLDQNTYVPHPLLPPLLALAVATLDSDRDQALRILEAGGARGRWLAAQHPEWSVLTATFDFARAWKRADQPGQQVAVLQAWRHRDPEAAREALAAVWEGQSPRNQEMLLEGLRPQLSSADHPFLLAALEPNRKGVRRVASELLLLAGEPTATRAFREIARSALGADGTLAPLPADPDVRDTLKAYGGLKAPETLGQRLLEMLPSTEWNALTGMPLARFWLRLPPLELRGAGRALLAYDDAEGTVAFVEFLLCEEPKGFPLELAGELVRKLPAETFDLLFDRFLDREKDALRLRGYARYLALQRKRHWSERLSKAMVTRLLDDLHRRELDYATQRDLALHWKQSIPLLHPDLFPWLRQQLHTATERYDVFGKLATRMLQVTSFRSQLRQA